MVGIDILFGFVGGAIVLVAGMMGALVGIIAGVIGCILGVALPLFPLILISVGIIWLVKGASGANMSDQSSRRANAAPTQSPRRLR
jgi:hypothetical protein